MANSFVHRLIRVTFNLATGLFTGTNSDTLTLSGLRVSARIAKAGAMVGCRLDLTIYGMTISQMNDLCTLGTQINLLSRNIVVVEAGDASGMATVFEGTILDAYANFNDQPNVVFIVTANSIGAIGVLSMEPTTLPSKFVNATETLRQIASIAGIKNFENNVGDVVIPGPIYLWGSPRDQIDELASMAGLIWALDDSTLAIYRRTSPRNVTQVPLVSPSTGLIRYPSYLQTGIVFETVFNPGIQFQGLVKLESAIFNPLNPDGTVNSAFTRGLAAGFFPANGVWAVGEIDHHLDSNIPNGDWKSIVSCYNPFYAPPAVAPNILRTP